MSGRKSRKAKTAEQIEADRIKREAKEVADQLIARANELDAVGIQKEAATLDRQADIAVSRAGAKREAQTVEGNSARRLDAFAALKDGMVRGAYDAARRFELDILIRRGENDRGRGYRVDCDVDPTYAAALKRVAAAERIEAVVERLPPRDWWLLMELISPSIDRGGWRETVLYITGESHAHGQGAAVRAACCNLRDAYAALERKAAA